MLMSRFVPIIFIVFIVSGCASIVSGTTQRVTLDSDPQGATVVIGKEADSDSDEFIKDSYQAGVTPLTVELPRRGSTMVRISKEGYKTQTVDLERTMNPWVWGDIALTSPLSTSIDTSTGAANQYKPGEYMITLQPDDTKNIKEPNDANAPDEIEDIKEPDAPSAPNEIEEVKEPDAPESLNEIKELSE